MNAMATGLRARLTDFVFVPVIVLGAVLWTLAPARAVTYIVDRIPLDKYDSAVDKDMMITVTFVSIDDPKDSFLWYKKTDRHRYYQD